MRGVGAPRVWAGLGIAAAGLTALTALLLPSRASASLASVALLFLVPVVAAAVIGGGRSGLVAALAADLVVNFFFVPPYRTLVVESPDHVIVLVIYVLVAATVSLAVDVAARQRATAARREVEASLLARVTAEPVAEESLTRLLEQVRATFAMTTVALLERDGDGDDERAVAQVGPVAAGDPVISAEAGAQLRLVGWGPASFAEDRQLLARLAAAAARVLEAQRLAGQAAQARELAEIDRLRAALLTAVGHDLRTPLAGIKAAVSSLRQSDISLPPDAQAELLATVEESADSLDALVENLLSMSRLQAGVMSVHARAVALDAVVAEALLHTADHGARVEVAVPDDLPLVHADPGLLERAVANLVANAQAATPPGRSIRLHGYVAGDRAHLDVIDCGPGIPAAERERVFEPFQRLPARTTTGGLGLGLAIARGFVDAMGGTLSPADTVDGGVTMTISLRLAGTP